MAFGPGAGWCSKARSRLWPWRKYPDGKSTPPGVRPLSPGRDSARPQTGLSFRSLDAAFEDRQLLAVSFRGQILQEAASWESLLRLGLYLSERYRAVAVVLISKDLLWLCVRDSDALGAVHRKCFHSGNFPLSARVFKTYKRITFHHAFRLHSSRLAAC